MISEASEFEFVTGDDIDERHPHGDLDRISITGEIDPSFEEATPLRGEIVAFMLEAMRERIYCGRNGIPAAHSTYSIYEEKFAFRRLPRAMDYAVRSFLTVCFPSTPYSNYWILDGDRLNEIAEVADIDEGGVIDKFKSIALTAEDAESEAETFRTKKPANSLEAIRKVYADIQKVNFFAFYANDPVSRMYNLTWSDFDLNGVKGNLPENFLGCLYYMHHIQAVTEDIESVWDRENKRYVQTSTPSRNYTAYLKSKALHLENDRFKVAKSVTLWALVDVSDFDQSRSESSETLTYHYYKFVKLNLEISGDAINDSYIIYPTNAITSMANRLISEAASAKSTGEWNTPFVIRNASPYDERNRIVNHRIKIEGIYLCPVCELRDKTRFEQEQ